MSRMSRLAVKTRGINNTSLGIALGLLFEKLKLGFGLELQSLLFLGQLNLVVVLLGLNDFGKL